MGMMIKASTTVPRDVKGMTITFKANIADTTLNTQCPNTKTKVEIKAAIPGFHSIHILEAAVDCHPFNSVLNSLGVDP